MTVSRRDIIMRGGVVALGTAVAVSPLGAPRDMSSAVRDIILELRNPPEATTHGTYLAFQDVADRLERVLGA